MKFLLRFAGFLFAGGTILFLIGVAGAAGMLWHYSKDLPDYSQLQDYEPPVMTRVHASDGALVAEYARERRLYIPIQAVPKRVIAAFIAAEDKNFYDHGGLDFSGIARAGVLYVQNIGTSRRPQGASTITQQVAKNFLLTNEVSFNRKIKEALLALKIERTYSKDKILELYLNEIYLGLGAYGIAAAALIYFDKSVHELTTEEAAYLAALPKAPTILHPFRQRERAIERRNYVIDRMVDDRYITAAEGATAKKVGLNVSPRTTGPHIFAADYFAEEVRRELNERYGEKKLYEGGLSVRTTLDPKMQVLARKVLADGLVKYDEAQGYRGAIQQIDITGDWGLKLQEVKSLSDIAPWRMAVVLETSDQSARVGLQPIREPGSGFSKERATGLVAIDGVKWAKPAAGPAKGRVPAKVNQVLEAGDVVYVEPITPKDKDKEGGASAVSYRLRQVPEVSGGIAAMDPITGRVVAMVGGFSFDQSQFNRATQALRQPGSSFKPFVYAAALDNGYTPSTVVMDAPIEVDQGPGLGVWRPENYSAGKYYGPQTLRFGIEHSRNVMTVRLAQDVGMPLITEYAKRFGVYDDLPPYLSFALGAGETTVLRMVAAYAMFDNGGRRIKPTLIDRIQDRYGHTIYKHDQRECKGCTADKWRNQNEPTLIDKREQVIDAMTAYQITSMMEGVVQRGTATTVREVGKPVAGKTGTTNDEKDVWFVGFSPDLVVGTYIGYGQAAAARARCDRRAIGRADRQGLFEGRARRQAGGAVPRAARHQADPHRSEKRLRAGPGAQAALLEAFKPGTAPPDASSIIGFQGEDGQPFGEVPAESGRAVRSGTGGLY